MACTSSAYCGLCPSIRNFGQNYLSKIHMLFCIEQNSNYTWVYGFRQQISSAPFDRTINKRIHTHTRRNCTRRNCKVLCNFFLCVYVFFCLLFHQRVLKKSVDETCISKCCHCSLQYIICRQASVKSFLKGLHSQSTFLVPKWIAFLPAIPFFHLDCDQIRNPFLQSCCIIMCTSGSGGGRGA